MAVKIVHINKIGTTGDLFVVRDFTPPTGPDNTLPGGGGGAGIPDNELPSYPPPQVPAGHTLVLVRTPDGKWKYAAIEPGQVVPPPLPTPPIAPTPEPKAY